jgi:hypothetical protein
VSLYLRRLSLRKQVFVIVSLTGERFAFQRIRPVAGMLIDSNLIKN